MHTESSLCTRGTTTCSELLGRAVLTLIDVFHLDCTLHRLFSAVSDVLAWAFMCAGIHGQVHYLDDFLLFGGPHSSEASENLHLALQVCRQLGIPVVTHKTEGPSTMLTFLGILVDSSHMELRLPIDKLHCLQSLVLAWACKKTC